MIIDHIRNRALYYGLGENFKIALDYLASYEAGRTEAVDEVIDGENIFVRIRPLTTKPTKECSIESHRRYADIHYVAEGIEKIGYADVKSLQEKSYNEDSDVAVLDGNYDVLTLEKGYFMITLADDAHVPCIMNEQPQYIEKLIAKVKL